MDIAAMSEPSSESNAANQRSALTTPPADSGAAQTGQRSPCSVEELIARISREMAVSQNGQAVHVEVLPGHQAEYAAPSPPLPPALHKALGILGIPELYTHQVEALERARRGENIVVVTATSSGKTLCYNLPVFESLLGERSKRALYLYPINALINDQLKSLFRMNVSLGQDALGVARYTGALSSAERQAARARNPHIWLTNPEMLHLSFLLWHANWEDFWRHLAYIVIDEVHTYRGVFGSNMAQLLRRVLRVAQHYGANPQFICCSATIANPKQLAETLTGCPFSVIDRDGAGSGRRYFMLWNPPLISDDGSNRRRSQAEEAVDLLRLCLEADYNTIVFARARRLTERMLRLSQGSAEGQENKVSPISSYRAGYLAEEREEIETRLKTGEIRGIITTNALEMGIDIGGLDAAIIAGYPGTIMSTRQQAGRAGRRGRDALVTLIASQNPLDQYYMSHPGEFFAQPNELAVVDLDNQHIRLKHLLCAARELPFLPAEVAVLPAESRSLFEELRQSELLAPCAPDDPEQGLTYPASRRDIHFRVSLRAASQDTYRIVDEKRVDIGTIEPPNVFREAHPGAIYQHGEDDYRVTFLDRQQKTVRVRAESLPHYTRSTSTLNLSVRDVYASQCFEADGRVFEAGLGDVLVEETIVGYQELVLGSDELAKRVNLDQPLAIRVHTTGMWIALSAEIEALVAEAAPPPDEQDDETSASSPDTSLAQGLHAVQHLLTGVMPLVVMCDRRDVDGFYHIRHPDLGAPAVFVYDAYEGGIGLTEVAYHRVLDLLRVARDTIAGCHCLAGCPSCIQSGTCRQRNEAISKPLALALLTQLAAGSKAASAQPRILATRSPDTAPALGRATLTQKRAIEDLAELTRRQGIYQRLATAESQPPPEPRYAPGDWVDQSPYGRGVVLSSRIEGQRELVQVRFVQRGLVKEIDASKGALRKVK